VASALGQWVLALDGSELPSRDLIGGKAWSVARMGALGLPVPPAIVVSTRACAAFLTHARFPDGLVEELGHGIAWLEQRTGRGFGGGASPLLVSVRSGAAVSMPGMMDTVLNLGITEASERTLAEECGDAGFARDTHRRFLDLYGQVVLKAPTCKLDPAGEPAAWREALAAASGAPVPDDVTGQLHGAVRAVFESWNSRRALRYRQHQGIADDLGTAVTIQAMVFGNLDARSGTGVLFSRNPLTGEPAPFGEYLSRAQGEDVVSGRFSPQPLASMQVTAPEALAELLRAARLLEEANGDVQDIEFTVERGRLFLLQSRSAKRAPKAAVRIAVDMVRERKLDVVTALSRVTPEQVRQLLSPRLAEGAAASASILARGEGACPGIGAGIVVIDPDEADRRARAGEAVVLARPTTSPEDVHAMIHAKAVITEQGGSTSHAAVVGRALGLPSVVGCGIGAATALAGQVVTVDGQSGHIYAGRLKVTVPREQDDADLAELIRWCEMTSPLQVLDKTPDGATVLDLDDVAGAEDPANLPAILPGVIGARGGAIASDAGVRAAVRAKLAFIVASPRLPALLAAVQAGQGN
jgi:pyruvate, orthophosphate dikinase